ncbi:unnamed protein product [Mytilus coruscus]|uniref:OTU domain-containing protein n=1 Tax=Mytilus coruscus TaxID=42192 RepID=A0A6J8APX3_MYTCO|nr:unnamed protein product [Mytilus coruscus]
MNSKNLNETLCIEDDKNYESDVEFLSLSDMSYDFNFKPLTVVTKTKLCAIVKIPTKHISKHIIKNINKMDPPSSTKSITGDGNCFLRAISYAISNRQECFRNVRKAIVNHLIMNAEMFRSFLKPRFKTVQEHIQTLKMEENNVWGTELEIMACADLLKTYICTFYNYSWIKYSSSQMCSNTKINVQVIYLHHQGGINHHEVVTAVTQKSKISANTVQSSEVQRENYTGDEPSLTGTLKRNNQTDNAHREEKKKQSKTSYWENDGARGKKINLGTRKYEEDPIYRKNLVQAGIEKYQADKDYRNDLIQSGVQKYQEVDTYRENLKQGSMKKYKEDGAHKGKVKQASVQKYKEDEEHKEKVKQASVQKCVQVDEHRVLYKIQRSNVSEVEECIAVTLKHAPAPKNGPRYKKRPETNTRPADQRAENQNLE